MNTDRFRDDEFEPKERQQIRKMQTDIETLFMPAAWMFRLGAALPKLAATFTVMGIIGGGLALLFRGGFLGGF